MNRKKTDNSISTQNNNAYRASLITLLPLITTVIPRFWPFSPYSAVITTVIARFPRYPLPCHSLVRYTKDRRQQCGTEDGDGLTGWRDKWYSTEAGTIHRRQLQKARHATGDKWDVFKRAPIYFTFYSPRLKILRKEITRSSFNVLVRLFVNASNVSRYLSYVTCIQCYWHLIPTFIKAKIEANSYGLQNLSERI